MGIPGGRKIGVFDSGLGGLSIFRKLIEKMPEYDYIYLADNARVPYGSKSAALIYKFTKEAVTFLFKKDCRLVILACNTATSNGLRRLQREYLPKHYQGRRILGIIRPVIEAAEEANLERIGIMATQATVTSNSYPAEIAKFKRQVEVFQQACPLLVPNIEQEESDIESLEMLIKKYTKPLLGKKIDSIILGCTHYALIEEKIKKYLPPDVKVISQGSATAEKLFDYLKRYPILEKKLSKNALREYLVTNLSAKYQKLVKHFLGAQIGSKIRLKLVKITPVR